MPLPLSARNQSSFMRPRQGGSVDTDRRPNEPFQSGYPYENRFGNFQNFAANGHPQTAALVNNYVFPEENPPAGFGFNDSNVTADDDIGDDSNEVAKNFSSANDGEDDLDEKPTDYSLRFQESEEPEYMSAPSGQPPRQQQQQRPQVKSGSAQKLDSNMDDEEDDDDDDDVCVDAVKSYFIEATPFDTPGAYPTKSYKRCFTIICNYKYL
jgi:hypothetical protein